MLTVETPIGIIIAPRYQEREVLNMADEEFCAALNTRPCNPFVYASWSRGDRRDKISWDGWSTFTLKK